MAVVDRPRKLDLEILIPVYNEGEGVLKTYEHLCQALGETLEWRATFIYDSPTDTTKPVLQRLQDNDPRHVHHVQQTFGRGVINAIKFGFTHVHDGPVAVVMGDDSDDLEKLPEMVRLCKEGALVVAASRFSPGGGYQGGEWLKKNLARLAGKTLHLAGFGTQDPSNNFKVYSGTFLKTTEIESVGGFEIALELTVKAGLSKSGRLPKGVPTVAEVPGLWRDRTQGQSNFKLFKWLPHYLKWFFFGLANQFFPQFTDDELDTETTVISRVTQSRRLLLLQFVPPLLYIAMILFGINSLLVMDEWDLARRFLSDGAQNFFAQVWPLHNEHRIFLPLVIMKILGWPASIKGVMCLSVAIFMATYFWVLARIDDSKPASSSDTTNERWQMVLLALMPFFYFNWTQKQIFFWSMQLVWLVELVGLLMAVWGALRGRLGLVVAGFLIAYFSLGGWLGLVPLLPLIAGIRWAQTTEAGARKMERRRFVACLTLGLAGLGYFLFERMTAPPVATHHAGFASGGILKSFFHFLQLLGSPFQLMGSKVALAMGIVFFVATLTRFFRRQLRESPFATCLIFLTFTLALICSLGRTHDWNILDHVRGRYLLLLMPGWIAASWLLLRDLKLVPLKWALSTLCVANIVIGLSKGYKHEVSVQKIQKEGDICLNEAIIENRETVDEFCTRYLLDDPARLLAIARELHAAGIYKLTPKESK